MAVESMVIFLYFMVVVYCRKMLYNSNVIIVSEYWS